MNHLKIRTGNQDEKCTRITTQISENINHADKVWGIEFPITALSKTALEYAIYRLTLLTRGIVVILLIAMTLLIGYMAFKTVYGLAVSRLS